MISIVVVVVAVVEIIITIVILKTLTQSRRRSSTENRCRKIVTVLNFVDSDKHEDGIRVAGVHSDTHCYIVQMVGSLGPCSSKASQNFRKIFGYSVSLWLFVCIVAFKMPCTSNFIFCV